MPLPVLPVTKSSRNTLASASTNDPRWLPDSELFSPDNLSTPDGLDNATISLQIMLGTAKEASALVEAIVSGLLLLPHGTFPLILSHDPDLIELVNTKLQTTFPVTAKGFSNSLVAKVLSTLKAFYHSIPAGDDDTDLDKFHHKVHTTLPALTTLADATFEQWLSSTITPPTPTSPTQSRQKKHRKSKSSSISVQADDNVFRSCGETRPRTADEAVQLQNKLLKSLKDTLQVYLSSLVLPISQGHAKQLVSQHSNLIANHKPSLIVKMEKDAGSGKIVPPPNIASAYTTVTTIQLPEEEIDGFGIWKLLLSSEAMRRLRQLRRGDQHMFDIVHKKMRELSHGFFSRSNQKRLVGRETEVPIFEAKMTNDTRLVYTIDCVPDGAGERVTQAIKVFGIYTHAQINSRLWAAVAYWSSNRGTEYRKRCLARQTSKEHSDYAIPCSWPPIPEIFESVGNGICLDKGVELELHALLTHEKYVPLTQVVLESILADEEATHPFSVSSREHEIIYHKSSCFVIGRSGTGKTTTMLFKMLGIERTARALGEKVRQVFITQSRVLAEKVEESFNNMIQACSGELLSLEERIWRSERRTQSDKDLVELDEEDESSSNLPTRFSELEDKHFPLFLSFDKLCRMLEADYVLEKSVSPTSPQESRRSDTILSICTEPMSNLASNTRKRRRRIKNEDFHSKYWPSFPQSLAKGLDSALVWNEFQGVIRGSECSLGQPSGAITRQTYESGTISFRKQAAFAHHRSRLYDLFEVYMKRKRDEGEYDAADRTHTLLRALEYQRDLTTFDYMYVDEVQDNLLIDAKLLRYLCHNPRGMFWAGDTAQQITSTAFRFSNLKAFLYGIEEADKSVQLRRRPAMHPKEFTLAVNYRSHGGIVDCAYSIVRLLTMLWPESIDVLEPEHGLVNGPKPVFFSGWTVDSVHYEQFLFGDVTERMEFGAQQCILVRNEAARDRLRSQIGDIGLIMTLYESKGLEFNDVLLYNFFEDSPVSNGWRVVLNGVEEKHRGKQHAPAFDELRHLGVCAELKFLYVGLTRARNHLWIWDGSPAAEFMRIFWESHDQIDVKRPGDPLPRLAVSSTPEEWAKMGRLLFSRENYQQAVLCFERADQALEAEISRAYHLRKVARLEPTGTDMRKEAFVAAATLFSHCGQGNHRQSRPCYLRAAACYVEAGRSGEASKAYYLGGDFNNAATYARLAGEFDQALDIIQNNPVNETVATSILEVCKVVYAREKSYSKAKELFNTEDEMLEHFDDCGFDKTAVLVELDRLREAAEYHLQNSRPVEAIELLLREGSTDAVQKAADLLIQELWLVLPYDRCMTEANRFMIKALLELSERAKDTTFMWTQQVAMFWAISRDDNGTLTALSESFATKDWSVPMVRCIIHLLRHEKNLKAISPAEMDDYLQTLHRFGSCLRTLLCKAPQDFVQSPDTQRLLGYIVLDDSSSMEAVVRVHSPLHELFHAGNRTSGYTYLRSKGPNEWVARLADVSSAARYILMRDLKTNLLRHDHNTKGALAFKSLCTANIDGRCKHGDTCFHLHVSSEGIKNSFNQRFRMFLGQMLVINDMDIALGSITRAKIRRYWMTRFMEVIYPQHSGAGKLADLTTNTGSPDNRIAEGLIVLRDWINESIWTLNLSNSPRVLEVFLIASAIDHYGVPRYIKRTRLLSKVPNDGFLVNQMTRKHAPIFLELFNGLFAHGDTAMLAAIGYLYHVIMSKTKLDANILVSTVEVITALLIAGLRPSLNGLVIPQSWLFVLGQRRTWPKTSSLHFTHHLLVPLMRLSKDIHGGCQHLTLNRKSMADVIPLHRRMLIERIFRCLILVGCNSGWTSTYHLIWQAITSASGAITPHELECWPSWYIRANSWEGLVTAITRSLSSSQTDGLIQLVKTGGPSVLGIKDVPQRHFSDVDSLFHLFITSPLVQLVHKARLNPEAKPFIPASAPSLQALTPASLTKQTPGTAIRTLNPTLGKLYTETMEESHLQRDYTEKEEAAAKTIQDAYRRYQRTCCNLSGADDSVVLGQLFKFYNGEMKHSQLSRRYLGVLRGPLLHFLYCLEAFKPELARLKAIAKKALNGDHRSLEAALSKMNEINAIIKFTHDTLRWLSPASSFHTSGDDGAKMDSLCEAINQAGSHMAYFWEQRPDLEGHFGMAFKAIVQKPEKKSPAKEEKPSLNTSDLLEL